jgi:hypothetical protein
MRVDGKSNRTPVNFVTYVPGCTRVHETTAVTGSTPRVLPADEPVQDPDSGNKDAYLDQRRDRR